VFNFNIIARIDGDKSPCELRISPKEVVELESFVLDTGVKNLKKKCQREDYLISNCMFTCGAGKNRVRIDPYGKLFLCSYLPHLTYDLRQGSFHEGWYTFIPTLLNQEHTEKYKCKGCKINSLCDNCACMAMLENDDFNVPVEYLCKIAHLRAKRLKLDVI